MGSRTRASRLLSAPASPTLGTPTPPSAAVKDRIVEALDQLYVNGWAGNAFTSAQASRRRLGRGGDDWLAVR